MNKIIFAVLFGILAIGSVYSDTVDEGDSWQFVEAQPSSGVVVTYGINSAGATVGSTRPATVMSIWSSSDSAAFTNWFQLYDTVPVNANDVANFHTSNIRSPVFNFAVTTFSTTNGIQLYKIADYAPYGVRCASAPYVFKNAASLGAARRVYLLMRTW